VDRVTFEHQTTLAKRAAHLANMKLSGLPGTTVGRRVTRDMLKCVEIGKFVHTKTSI